MSDATVNRDMLGLSNAYSEPVSRLERTVTEIWRRHFSMDRVGIHDRYEDLGGDSLLAVKIIIDIEKELSVELPWNVLEDADTTGKLSAIIATMKDAPAHHP
jgi:phthiocerol/phenolphthiocerol synthesis type-I polyketide synthase E